MSRSLGQGGEGRGGFSSLIIVAALLAALALRVGSGAMPARAEAPDRAMPAGAKRLALLIGVGDYDQSGPHPWPRLHVADDLSRLRKVLRMPQHGFQDEDIVVLSEKQATGAAIRAEVQRHLLNKARPGSVIVIYFAGHGQRILDDNEDELDGLDESLVPADAVDTSPAAGARVNIRDDEVRRWVEALQGRMRVGGRVQGSINLFIDACFAGGAARSSFVVRGRGWQPELDGEPSVRRARTRRPEGLLDQSIPGYVLLAAAHDDQEAQERDGGGVFSRALVNALRRVSPQTTYRSLYDEILVETIRAVRDQTPVLEGNGELRLWAGRIGEPAPTLVTVDYAPDRMLLHAGALQLVTSESRYALHRAGGEPISELTKLAEAEVVAVGSTTSQLRLLSPATLPVDAVTKARPYIRAVELCHQSTHAPLIVNAIGIAQHPLLHDRLRALDFIRLADREVASPDFDLRICAGQLVFRRAGLAEPLLVAAVSPAAAEQLEETLRREWHWRQFATLDAPSSTLKVALTILPLQSADDQCHRSASLSDGHAGRADLAPGQHVRMHAGDRYGIQLTNQTDLALYVTVFEIDPTGCITPLFPQPELPGNNLIAGRGTVRFPDDLEYCLTGASGLSMLKVVATRTRVDLLPQLLQAHAETCATATLLSDTRAPTWNPVGPAHGFAEELLGLLRVGRLSASTAERAQSRRVELPQGTWGVSTSSLELLPNVRAHQKGTALTSSCPQ